MQPLSLPPAACVCQTSQRRRRRQYRSRHDRRRVRRAECGRALDRQLSAAAPRPAPRRVA
ncbi:Protein of unknown function [Gryllus bimaculatus]|nr:Protein of unknown function [Gryllus bimaculatus]